MPSLASLLVPLFGAIAVGAFARIRNLFDGEDARRMARFVFMVAMPFAGFDFMRRTTIDGEVIAGLGLAYVASLAAVSGLTFFVARRFLGLSVREAGAAVFASTCGNAIFLGLPIALSVPQWTTPFLILTLFEGTLCFAIGTALMTWPENGSDARGQGLRTIVGTARHAAGRALASPIVIGTLLGVAAAVADPPMPEPLSAFFGFMGRIAGPLGLFVLGVTAADLMIQRRITTLRPLYALLPVKLALFPALTGVLAWRLTADPGATAAAVLFTGLPPAVASIVLSSVYGQWTGGVATVVTGGSAIGLLTLAGFLVVALPS